MSCCKCRKLNVRLKYELRSCNNFWELLSSATVIAERIKFLHLSVSHSVHRGGVPGRTPPLGRHTPWADISYPPGRPLPPFWADTPSPRTAHCSRRYATYWNAFFDLKFSSRVLNYNVTCMLNLVLKKIYNCML